jgi:hypothetical protein
MDFGVSIMKEAKSGNSVERVAKMKEAKSNGEVYLKSVGCVLDSSNAMVYPMLADGSTDLLDEGVSLRHVTEEWIDTLSEEDVIKVGEVVDNLNMNIVDYPEPISKVGYWLEYLKDGIRGSVLELK